MFAAAMSRIKIYMDRFLTCVWSWGLGVGHQGRRKVMLQNVEECYVRKHDVTRGHSESADLRQGSSSVSTYFCHT